MLEPSDVAYPWVEQTDVAFLGLAHEKLHAGGVQLAIGTHDPVLREALLATLDGIDVEMLLGVRPEDGTRPAAPWTSGSDLRPLRPGLVSLPGSPGSARPVAP